MVVIEKEFVSIEAKETYYYLYMVLILTTCELHVVVI